VLKAEPTTLGGVILNNVKYKQSSVSTCAMYHNKVETDPTTYDPTADPIVYPADYASWEAYYKPTDGTNLCNEETLGVYTHCADYLNPASGTTDYT
jgi:hypothetical protein